MFGDEYEDYEPSVEEIEALLAAEEIFREEHGFLDDDAWNAYCLDRARDWLEGQDDDPALAPPHERARAFVLEDIRTRVGIGPAAPGRDIAPDVPTRDRWPYELTPIEAQFYDALAETGLTFSVQPWMQHADRKYRADFLIYYDGRAVVIELDGHDYHKTKEQRGRDAQKALAPSARHPSRPLHRLRDIRGRSSMRWGAPRRSPSEPGAPLVPRQT